MNFDRNIEIFLSQESLFFLSLQLSVLFAGSFFDFYFSFSASFSFFFPPFLYLLQEETLIRTQKVTLLNCLQVKVSITVSLPALRLSRDYFYFSVNDFRRTTMLLRKITFCEESTAYSCFISRKSGGKSVVLNYNKISE